MQITGQLFSSLLLGFDHAFTLIHNILVETCILDGNYCLAAKLPWAKKWLLPAGIIAAMGRRGRHIYGR